MSNHIRVAQGEVLEQMFPGGQVDEDEAIGDSISSEDESSEGDEME